MHLSGLEKITSLSCSCPKYKVEIKITYLAGLLYGLTEVICESTLGHKVRKISILSLLASFFSFLFFSPLSPYETFSKIKMKEFLHSI